MLGKENVTVSGVWLWLKNAGLFKWLTFVLVLVVIAMLAVWRPWQTVGQVTDRTISVSGTATVTAVPDQFVFSPTYSFMNADKQVALNALTAKADEIVKKLKDLGVPSSAIKTNASGYQSYGYGYLYMPVYGGSNTYTLSFSIKLSTETLAQKVQDYLVTTSPTGDVTPQVSFTTAKQQALQSQARNKAEQNARSQADQSARNLGFSIAAVKSVVDGSQGGGPIMYGTNLKAGAALDLSQPELAVQPGTDDLTYTVDVVYYIR